MTRHQNRRRAATLGSVPQIISRIPRPYPSSQEQLGAAVTSELDKILAKIISEREVDQGVRLPQGELVTPEHSHILDALILRQAETMGWRLALSERVLLRFSEWDSLPNGPELFEQYGKALARSARRFQKKERPPVDLDLYHSKRETVEELRVLLRNVRNTFSTRRSQPTSDELIDYFQRTVSAQGDVFIYLKTNVDSWAQFFRADSTEIKPFLLGQRTSPAALFDSWIAWSTGFERETIRQKISELKRTKL